MFVDLCGELDTVIEGEILSEIDIEKRSIEPSNNGNIEMTKWK